MITTDPFVCKGGGAARARGRAQAATEEEFAEAMFG